MTAGSVPRPAATKDRHGEEMQMRSKQLVFAAGLLGLCAIGVGVVAHEGPLSIPEPDRAMLRGVRAGSLAEIERLRVAGPPGRPDERGTWHSHLAIVDTELAHGHVDAAVRAWHDAYGAALESRSWEAMIAVGDGFVRIGQAAGTPRGARMNAREAYISGLIRAFRAHSVEGALRSAAALEALGDHAAAEHGRSIAGQLAAGDARAQELVHRSWERRAALHALAEF